MIRILGLNKAFGLFVGDEAGTVLYANDAHCEFLGRSQDEVVGHNFREWTPADRLPQAELLYKRIIAGEAVSFPRTINKGDGTLASAYYSLYPSRTEANFTVLGTIREYSFDPQSPYNEALDVALYVETVSNMIADVASQSGFAGLKVKLDLVASEATKLRILAGQV